MIDTKHPDYQNLKNSIRENPKEFVAFIGSGLPRCIGLPNWKELLYKLIEDAEKRITELPEERRETRKYELRQIQTNDNLWNSFSDIKNILTKQAYENAIIDALRTNDNIPLAYELLWKLNIKGILTYNLDKLAIDSYSKVNRRSVDSATGLQASNFSQFLSGSQQFVFQPHGVISNPSTWIFTEEERHKLYGNSLYLDFLKSIFRTKQVLIIGLNPEDFALKFVLQNTISTVSDEKWPNHYIFMNNPDQSIIRELGNKSISVIPYKAENDKHIEIPTSLQDFLNYLPQDKLAHSVYDGAPTLPGKLPNDNDLIQMPTEEFRRLLNGAISNIIPPTSSPQDEDIEKLEIFYKQHIKAIHNAWLIEPDTEYNILYGYKIKELIGEGAFGQVFQAEKEDTNTRVAIKVLLHDRKYRMDYLNSFRRGVKSMRILLKNNVERMVKIYDAYEIPACVIMEFIDGLTLTRAVNYQHINTLHDSLDILLQVGDTVYTAHNLAERVLHRDLKPDNVILRDYYTTHDSINVVVLDFDLSWHKGASDMSVVHGARAQGYAAPEQTATGRLKGVSTRHVGVDVFGYGMLAFFVFTGNDPTPNEHQFKGFKDKIQECIRNRFNYKWECLPALIAETIDGCCKNTQSERIPFNTALENFRVAFKMCSNNRIQINHPALLRELAIRIDSRGNYEVSEFGRKIEIITGDGSKTIKMELENNINKFYIHFELQKNRTDHDHRNILKYIDKAKDRALGILNTKSFFNLDGFIGKGLLKISADYHLPDELSVNEIANLAKQIDEAKAAMSLD